MKLFKIFLGFLIFLGLSTSVRADIPNLINFQGVLADTGGNPSASETVSVEFKIYDALVGGSLKWSETQSVTTNSDGLFNVLLGSSTPIPDSAFDDTLRWLGIKVGTDAEMTPRQQIVSSAYGYRVGTVDGASGGIISGDVNIQSDLAVSGKVGIGTTSPGSRLTVQGPESSRGLRVTDGTSTSNIVIQPLDGSNSGFQAINFNGFRDFSEQRFNTVKNRWRLYVDQRGGNDFFNIDTYDGVGTSNLFSILSNGNIGIGTTSPAAKLEIQSPLTTEGGLMVRMTNSGGWVPARFINSNNGQTIVEVIRDYGTTLTDIDRMALFVNSAEAGIYTDKTGVGVARPITFKPAGVEAMRIAVGGNVGIDHTTPEYKLDIGGSDKGLRVAGPGGPGTAVKIGGNGDFSIDAPGVPSGRFVVKDGGNVGVGTASPQGALDVSSTTGALIVPRMITAQRDALTAVNGMIIYNTTTNQFNFYENGAWVTK